MGLGLVLLNLIMERIKPYIFQLVDLIGQSDVQVWRWFSAQNGNNWYTRDFPKAVGHSSKRVCPSALMSQLLQTGFTLLYPSLCSPL